MAQVGQLGRAMLRAAAVARRAGSPSAGLAGSFQHKSTPVALQLRSVSSSRTRLHDRKTPDDAEDVAIRVGAKAAIVHHEHEHAHDDDELDDDEDDEDMVEMVAIGPMGKEWGGPTRGGMFKEPTRFGDWERKGRCSDF